MNDEDEREDISNQTLAALVGRPSSSHRIRATPSRRRLMSAPTNPRWSPSPDERRLFSYVSSMKSDSNSNSSKSPSPPSAKMVKRMSGPYTVRKNHEKVQAKGMKTLRKCMLPCVCRCLSPMFMFKSQLKANTTFQFQPRGSPPSDGSDKIHRFGESPTPVGSVFGSEVRVFHYLKKQILIFFHVDFFLIKQMCFTYEID